MPKLPIISIFLILLVGCENSMQESKDFIATIKKSKGIAIEPLPQPLQYNHFEYSAGFSRSPFDAPQQELTIDIISKKISYIIRASI